jgi:hypothetical protein
VLDSLREAFAGSPPPPPPAAGDDASGGYAPPITGAPPPHEPELEALAAFETLETLATRDAVPRSQPKGGADDPWSIIERQLLSGLWDEPHAVSASHARDEDVRVARATIAAMTKLLAAGVTTAHPLYGEPMRKAIEALLTLLPRLTRAEDDALRTQALEVSWLAAEGRRARKLVRGAIDALAPALAARLDDEAALRAEVGLG